jgi:hypothetical protein
MEISLPVNRWLIRPRQGSHRRPRNRRPTSSGPVGRPGAGISESGPSARQRTGSRTVQTFRWTAPHLGPGVRAARRNAAPSEILCPRRSWELVLWATSPPSRPADRRASDTTSWHAAGQVATWSGLAGLVSLARRRRRGPASTEASAIPPEPLFRACGSVGPDPAERGRPVRVGLRRSCAAEYARDARAWAWTSALRPMASRPDRQEWTMP